MNDHYAYAIDYETNINSTIYACIQARMTKDCERYMRGVESLMFLLRPSFSEKDKDNWKIVEQEGGEYLNMATEHARAEFDAKKHDPLEDPVAHHYNYSLEADMESQIYDAQIECFDMKFEFLCGSGSFSKYGREQKKVDRRPRKIY